MTRSEFSSLVHRLSKKLYIYAYRILRDQEGSEDAVQEIFIKLWKMNEKLREYESVEALATTMVKNYCIDQLRKLKHINPDDENAMVHYPDSNPTPYDKLEINEAYALMERIINNLPENYRVIIRLRDIDGLSFEEIADKTGQNINTLRVSLSRARKTVRDEYKKHNDEFRGHKTIA